jgi:hypothetical protein
VFFSRNKTASVSLSAAKTISRTTVKYRNVGARSPSVRLHLSSAPFPHSTDRQPLYHVARLMYSASTALLAFPTPPPSCRPPAPWHPPAATAPPSQRASTMDSLASRRGEELRVTPPRRRVARAAAASASSASPPTSAPASSSAAMNLHSSEHQGDIALKAHAASVC